MLMIIFFHSGFYFAVAEVSNNETLQQIIKTFTYDGKVGVNIFVLISSYFMINKKFKWSRILNLAIQTWFYSILILIGYYSFSNQPFDILILFRGLFPLIFNKYWFITTFTILMFLIPFLNKYIKRLNKKQHFLHCLIPASIIIIIHLINEAGGFGFNDLAYLTRLIWFVVLYFIGSYIKLYDIKIKKIILIPLLIITYTARITLIYFFSYSLHISSISCLLIPIFLLLIFKDLKFKNKFINKIASTMFGVYLIHDNSELRCLWGIFINGLNSHIHNFIVSLFIVVILVFISCIIIDLIRQATVHKLTIKLLNLVDTKCEQYSLKRQEKILQLQNYDNNSLNNTKISQPPDNESNKQSENNIDNFDEQDK